MFPYSHLRRRGHLVDYIRIMSSETPSSRGCFQLNNTLDVHSSQRTSPAFQNSAYISFAVGLYILTELYHLVAISSICIDREPSLLYVRAREREREKKGKNRECTHRPQSSNCNSHRYTKCAAQYFGIQALTRAREMLVPDTHNLRENIAHRRRESVHKLSSTSPPMKEYSGWTDHYKLPTDASSGEQRRSPPLPSPQISPQLLQQNQQGTSRLFSTRKKRKEKKKAKAN